MWIAISQNLVKTKVYYAKQLSVQISPLIQRISFN